MHAIIDHKTSNDVLFPKKFGRGHDPAQATQNRGYLPEITLDQNGETERTVTIIPPKAMGAAPSTFKLIPRSEWDARYDEQQARKNGLRHLKQTMNKGKPHLSFDQNGQGYCWSYSVGGTIMYARGRDNQPYRRISPHAVACKIKNFQDQGGWCGLGMKWAIENGYPEESFWPQKSMARANDKTATWENAKKYRITESCFDASRQVWDQEMFIDLVATFLFLNVPLALDFNWWGHSVCGIEWTRIERGSWGPTIDNSWTPSWGDDGLATLQGNRATPDGAVGSLVATAA